MVIHVEQVAQMISFATRLVEHLQEQPELMDKYKDDIKELVDEYNMEMALLKIELERYFEMERRMNYPVNLSLHRAYEKLRSL